jgi:hypothetical protein
MDGIPAGCFGYRPPTVKQAVPGVRQSLSSSGGGVNIWVVADGAAKTALSADSPNKNTALKPEEKTIRPTTTDNFWWNTTIAHIILNVISVSIQPIFYYLDTYYRVLSWQGWQQEAYKIATTSCGAIKLSSLKRCGWSTVQA